MKTTLLLLLFSSVIITAYGQKEEKSPTVKFLNKRGYRFPDKPVVGDTSKKSMNERTVKWPEKLYYNTVYKPVFLGSPTIPVSFTRVEYVNGQYQVSPTVSIGYGYTWFFGHIIFNENDKLTVDPVIFLGLVAYGSLQNNFNLKKPAGFFTGGFIGTQSFTIYYGYDWITKSMTFSIGSRIDLYTISQLSLRPFGKVRELRKHKRIAVQIEDE